MAANWFLRLTAGAQSWAARDLADNTAEADYSPIWVVIEAITADFSPVWTIGTAGESGVIDGGGTLPFSVEGSYSPTWNVFRSVERDFTIFWQIPMQVSPARGVLRFVGNAPTITNIGQVQRDFTATWLLVDTTSADFSYFWSVDSTQGVNPIAGAFRFTGYAPTVINAEIRESSPTAGALVFAGQAPTLAIDYRAVSPEAGVLRFVGNYPSLDPKVVSPLSGEFVFVGLEPFVDLAHKFADPESGVLRFVGLAIREFDYSPVWQVTATAITADFEPFWNVGGSLTADYSPVWSVNGGVDLIIFRSKQREFSPRITTRTVEFTAQTRQTRITQRAS